MPNAKNDAVPQHERILVIGPPGSGKTFQIRTLPGKKFVYFFDPSGKRSITGADIDYEEFLPAVSEADWTLKGFNKGSMSDKPKVKKEPTVYKRFEDDINQRYDSGFFDSYDWVCFDSLTLLSRALMQRILYLNGRYGDVEDLSDYRIAGSKLSEILAPIASMKVSLYLTCHAIERQNDTTKRISTEIDLPGAARSILPKLCSQIFELRSTTDTAQKYNLLTRAEPRGYQGLRCTLQGVEPLVDVTVKDRNRPEQSGIGALLTKHGFKTSALAPAPALAVDQSTGAALTKEA